LFFVTSVYFTLSLGRGHTYLRTTKIHTVVSQSGDRPF